MAMVPVLPLLIISLLGLTVAGQEAAMLPRLHERTSHLQLQPLLPHSTIHPSPSSIAVSVGAGNLPAVSSSVLLAESWLRRHVLSRFPSTNITAVVVGRGVLCSPGQELHWGLVLPSVKNLHHSLVRWGLQKEIKVSAAFPSECLSFHELVRPLLSFLRLSNSFYLVDPQPHSSPPENTHSLVSAHRVTLEKLGFSQLLEDVWLIKEEKPIGRRLSSFTSTPYQKPISFPSRGHVGDNPNSNPPSPLFASSPDGSFSFVPVAAPSEVPENPPGVFAMPPPPCAAAPAVVPFPPVAPAPRAGDVEKVALWCVAKPTVPADALQEAMDYACGEGGADCEEIKPQGSCYNPDNMVAHASYAFNSYWQKTKRSGGSCNFEGTAVLINSDPSFLQCRFVLS